MDASKENTSLSVMEEVQCYKCIYDTFSNDYENQQARDKCWVKVSASFGLTVAEAEKKSTNMWTAYGRFLQKSKSIPSGSGRDVVSVPGEFGTLGWLNHFISQRASVTKFTEATDSEFEDEQDAEFVPPHDSQQEVGLPVEADGISDSKEEAKKHQNKEKPAPKFRVAARPSGANKRTNEEVDLAIAILPMVAERVLGSPDNQQEDDDSLFG